LLGPVQQTVAQASSLREPSVGGRQPNDRLGPGRVRCNNVELMLIPPPAAGMSPLARLASAVLLCVAAAGQAAAQPGPVSRLACGSYEAVPSGKASSGQPTRLSIQKGGRLLLTISDWSITRLECADIGGDKVFDLLVSSYSGGAHCCETLHVWALGEKPQKLLEYPAGNAGGFELRDLDADGRQELLLGDDSFAYFGDLCYACSPDHLPMVVCRTPRGFEDCTRKFPEVLRDALARLADRLKPPADADDLKYVEGAALGSLAVWSLLGEEDKGLESIRAAVSSDEVMKWLERARPQVRDWVAARGKRIKNGR
jgi:hypothetical protein